MKMWSVNVMILLLSCYACLSTGNGAVRFDSRNFNNVLRWDPVEPAFPGQKVLYTVQYWSDAKDQPFQVKKECQNTTHLFCNLTPETPSVHDVHYRAQVFANEQFLGRTNTFKPLADTILGKANLSTYTTHSSLHVDVTLPLGPNGVSIKDIIVGSKNASARTVPIYLLRLTHPTWATQVSESTTGQFVIKLKNNQTEYCGNVVYKPSSERGRSESESASFCVTMADDPWVLLRWVLVSVAVVAGCVFVAVVCACKYVKGGKLKSESQALDGFFVSREVLQPKDNLCIISIPVVCTQTEKTVYATILPKPPVSAVRPGGYSPQENPCHTWGSSTGSSVDTSAHRTGSNHNDTSGQSTDNYGEVVVQVLTEENENVEQGAAQHEQTSQQPFSNRPFFPWVNGGKLASCGAPPDLDAYESKTDTPLLLDAVRNPHGELTLPLLTFQLQSCAGDGKSPVNPEKRLHLSDVTVSTDGLSLASLQRLDSSEWSDSGCDDSTITTPTHPYCNTHYSPSQTVVPEFHQSTISSESISESGYKQNWMPTIFCGDVPIDNCNYRRTSWTGVHEEDEGRGEEETFFLETGQYKFKNSFPFHNVSDAKIDISHVGP